MVVEGACMVAGGHAWLPGGMCGCRGGHVWLQGGMCGCWGHAWLLGVCMVAGGMCGCRGVCVVAGGMCGYWGCGWLWGGMHGCWVGSVPCDPSHHAFDVTCMLPPHQLRHINSAPAYILLPGHVTCKACWDTHPSPVNRMTDRCKNITLP